MSDKTVAVFNGAMGDFFTVWPALRLLALDSPGTELRWAGRGDVMPWLEHMGYRRAGPELEQALVWLYAGGEKPRKLAGWKIFRFGLRPNQNQPPNQPREGVTYLPALDPDGFRPPRLVMLDALARHGISHRPGWLEDFRNRFGVPELKRRGKTALLFPGAGHRAKRWPMVKFFELARKLGQRDLDPLFVLGPVELEDGLKVDGFDSAAPQDINELARLIATARLGAGNDCGPMHLAGMMGLPGAVLFGPTSARQWAPPGLAALKGQADCRPCTRTTAGLDCKKPTCMDMITVEQAMSALEQAL